MNNKTAHETHYSLINHNKPSSSKTHPQIENQIETRKTHVKNNKISKTRYSYIDEANKFTMKAEIFDYLHE